MFVSVWRIAFSSSQLRCTVGCAERLRRGWEQATGRKKVGRPIEYEGDPDSPLLSEQERRRIKRRISNRESARRVRHKRQEVVDEMQATVSLLTFPHVWNQLLNQVLSLFSQCLFQHSASLQPDDGMQMDKLKEHNSKLQTRAQKSDYEKQQLAKQLSSLEGKYEQMSAENSRMAMEVHGLRQTLQVCSITFPPQPIELGSHCFIIRLKSTMNVCR